MRFVILVLLLLAAHFSLTPFAPAPAGKASFYWPFAADSRSWLTTLGGLPQSLGSVITPLLAGLAGLGFLMAALSLFGWVVPANWWLPTIVVAVVASIGLYSLYFGLWSLLPIAIDSVLVWGVFIQHWTATGLRGL